MSVRKHRGQLEVAKGFGLPRYTTVQRLTYVPPEEGYIVWDTDEEDVYRWDGTEWTVVPSFRFPWKVKEQWIKPAGTIPTGIAWGSSDTWSATDLILAAAPDRLTDFMVRGETVTIENVGNSAGLNAVFSGDAGANAASSTTIAHQSQTPGVVSEISFAFNQGISLGPGLALRTQRTGTTEFILTGGAVWDTGTLIHDTLGAIVTGNGTDTLTVSTSHLGTGVTPVYEVEATTIGLTTGFTIRQTAALAHVFHDGRIKNFTISLPSAVDKFYTVQRYVDGTLVAANNDDMNDYFFDLTGLYQDIPQLKQIISSPAHGLTLPTAGFIPLGASGAPSQDDVVDTAFYAVSFPDASNIEIVSNGIIDVFGHGLAVGQYYYVDATTPGALTSTKPRPESFAIAIAPTIDKIVLSDTGVEAADIPAVTQLYNLLTDLPLPATKLVGTEAKVVNDGANNGSYTAVGATVGANALAWVKG